MDSNCILPLDQILSASSKAQITAPCSYERVTALDEDFAPVLSLDELFPALNLATSEVADGLAAEVYVDCELGCATEGRAFCTLTANLVKVSKHLREFLPGKPGKHIHRDVLIFDDLAGSYDP